MSNIALALMWSAVLLTTMAAAELPILRRLIPAGDKTSVRFELALITITLITIAALTILLADIIGPGPAWDLNAGTSVPSA